MRKQRPDGARKFPLRVGFERRISRESTPAFGSKQLRLARRGNQTAGFHRAPRGPKTISNVESAILAQTESIAGGDQPSGKVCGRL